MLPDTLRDQPVPVTGPVPDKLMSGPGTSRPPCAGSLPLPRWLMLAAGLDSAAVPPSRPVLGTGSGLPFPGTRQAGVRYRPGSHFPGTASPPSTATAPAPWPQYRRGERAGAPAQSAIPPCQRTEQRRRVGRCNGRGGARGGAGGTGRSTRRSGWQRPGDAWMLREVPGSCAPVELEAPGHLREAGIKDPPWGAVAPMGLEVSEEVGRDVLAYHLWS